MKQRLRLIREILDHPTNRAHRCSALVRYIKWHVARRLLDRTDYAIRLAPSSAQVILSNRENYTTMVYMCGQYDYDEMQFLSHYLRPGDVFGDFGANVGVYSVLAGSVGATVLAVEPIPDTFSRLQNNLRLNNVQGQAVCCGLADTSGTLQFTSSHGGMNHVAQAADSQTIPVEVCTVDELVAKSGLAPCLLKIDVEGFELPLLRGAPDLLTRTAAVIIELNGSGQAYGRTDEEVHAWLLEAGFGCFDYLPESRELRSRSDFQRARNNSLYVSQKRLQETRSRLRAVATSEEA